MGKTKENITVGDRDRGTILKEHFPMLRDREEILTEIHNNWKYQQTFIKWTEKQQEKFLDICTGVIAPDMCYDSFFKEAVNPEYTPERLSDFLSEIMGQKVRVVNVLPNDSVRITLENTLLITDIVVELEDGSFADIEMQKIGYKFPGERAACYIADLLLRQYKRVRGEKKDVDYRDIKPVYLIVIFEKSPEEFKAKVEDENGELRKMDTYIHHVVPKSDTGVKLNLLNNFCFIALDMFEKKMHNKPIENRCEAWLRFFSSQEPEKVVELITDYPEFKPMYEDVYRLCMDTGRVMNVFSEELYVLDQNTMKLMIDEMQDEVDDLKEENDDLKEEIDGLQKTNDNLQNKLRAYKEKYGDL